MLAKVARPFVIAFDAVAAVVFGIYQVFAWLAGSSNPNRYSGSYRSHQRAIGRRNRHR